MAFLRVYMEDRRASPTKRAGFHLAFTWEKPGLLLPRLARLAESPGLTTFIFPRNQESVFAYKFSSYNLHINRACEMNIYLKNPGQNNLCRVYGVYPLKCVYMENFQLTYRRDLGSQ